MTDGSEKKPHTAPEGSTHPELDRAIRKAVSLPADDGLTPDPAIRSRLMQRLQDTAAARRRSWQVPLLLNRALHHRIPLYQAVLAVALVLLLLLPALEFVKNSRYQSGGVIADSTRWHESPAQIAAVDSTPTQTVPLGRTMREDSLLLRLIVSTR